LWEREFKSCEWDGNGNKSQYWKCEWEETAWEWEGLGIRKPVPGHL